MALKEYPRLLPEWSAKAFLLHCLQNPKVEKVTFNQQEIQLATHNQQTVELDPMPTSQILSSSSQRSIDWFDALVNFCAGIFLIRDLQRKNNERSTYGFELCFRSNMWWRLNSQYDLYLTYQVKGLMEQKNGSFTTGPNQSKDWKWLTKAAIQQVFALSALAYMKACPLKTRSTVPFPW